MPIPNTTYRFLVEKLGESDPTQFIGNKGEVFYDPNSPELRLSDGETAGGVSIGGAASGALTINDVGDSSYTLQLSDAGGGVLIYDASVRIPADSEVDFAIGTIITIIVGSDDVAVRPTSAASDGVITVRLAGTQGSFSEYWVIPEYNVASLIKVAANEWLLSGPGIFDDD